MGAGLGFIAGLTGIGGGIFLAPVLYILPQWKNPKHISGACSFFILVNSIAGLCGQSLKLGDAGMLFSAITSYWYLFPAVLIGGQLGSWVGSSRLNESFVKKMTGVLILYVSLRLLWRFWVMF